MENTSTYQLKISIDVHSIKDHDFTAQLYLIYKAIPALSFKAHRTTPTQSITIPRVETQLNNCFTSTYFEAQKDNIKHKLYNYVDIELWHNDRLTKDVLLGLCRVSLQNVLSMPLRKTKDNYARVLDVYAPVDQVDNESKPIKQIASIRVLIYLQDLGPIALLKQKGFNINNLLNQEIEHEMVHQLKQDHKQQDYKRLELNQLQYKVVWELETWKKAEQAKTKVSLRQKQIQFLTNLEQTHKKNNLEKQKQIKKIQANLYTIQAKLKNKMNQLIKRQQKIIILEQQLQTKLSQVSKQLMQKDQQIQRIKKRQKEEKNTVQKQKSILEIQISKLKAQNAKLRVQIEQTRKQDQKSPINILKNEINHKIMEIKQLTKQLDKCIQMKQQYKIHYQQMKNQVISLRNALKEKQENLTSFKYQNAILNNNIKHLEQQLQSQKNQVQQQHHQYYRQNTDYYQQPNVVENKKEKLIRDRQNLLEYGPYSPDDPLIKQYDNIIASL